MVLLKLFGFSQFQVTGNRGLMEGVGEARHEPVEWVYPSRKKLIEA